MSPVDRRSSADGHILIGGTGRAGTTLLVQYFTALGFDTGFSLTRALQGVDTISRAGLEHPYSRVRDTGRRLPYVAKSPLYGQNLHDDLASGALRVKHCIVPVRELSAAAESRRRVTRDALASGKSAEDKQRGGIVGGARAFKQQERLLAVQFHRLVHTMLHFDVPLHLLTFPDFAQGRQDLWTALEPVMNEHGVTREESAEALRTVLRPDFITDFHPPS